MRLLFLALFRAGGIASSTVSGRVGNRIRAVELTPETSCRFRGVLAGVGSMAVAERIEDVSSGKMLECFPDFTTDAVEWVCCTIELVCL